MPESGLSATVLYASVVGGREAPHDGSPAPLRPDPIRKKAFLDGDSVPMPLGFTALPPE